MVTTAEQPITGQPIKGRVHSLETFGLVDGPGVRFVVFLQGCAMRCQYCHNPETWCTAGGQLWTAQDLLDRACRYRRYWGKDGGITVSGGEPLLQMDFLTEFFALAKERGIHTTLDTAGQPFTTEEPFYSKFQRLMEFTDLVMLDLKHLDSQKHRRLTGWSNESILAMARWLSDHGVDLWIRRVLVPGVSDDTQELQAVRSFIDGLATVRRVEVLPYHDMGAFKWRQLGLDYPLAGVPSPDQDSVARAEAILGCGACGKSRISA